MTHQLVPGNVMGVSKTQRTEEHRMTAQGKINASNVQTGHRIIVKLHRNDAGLLTHISESRTKTGADVIVARVTGKDFRSAQGPYEARGKYLIHTTVGTFEAAPIQTMWLAPEDAAGIKRALAEAVQEDEERAAQAVRDAAKEIPATETPSGILEDLGLEDTDPLEAQAVVDTHSVAATSDAYWTKGCGADILERERTGIHAGAANGVHDFQADPATGGLLCGRLITTPAGTPVTCREPVKAALHDPGAYAAYGQQLKAALADWVEEGQRSLVADVEVVRDEAGQPSSVAVTRVPDSGYPSTSYVPVELPQRVPGVALADSMAAELVEDLADVALAQATRPEAVEHAVRHGRHARPGHTAQVQLLPMREELMGYASAELCLAIGSEWGRLEGKRLRVAALSVEDVDRGLPLYLVEAGDDEPRWWNAGTRSRLTGYVLLVGKTITVNSRPYEVRHTMAWGVPRLFAVDPA